MCSLNRWNEKLARGSVCAAWRRAANISRGGAAVEPGRGRPPRAAAAEQYKIRHNELAGQSVELVSLQWGPLTHSYSATVNMAESGDGYVTYEEEFTQIWEEVQDEVDKARALDFSPKLFTKGKCQMCRAKLCLLTLIDTRSSEGLGIETLMSKGCGSR